MISSAGSYSSFEDSWDVSDLFILRMISLRPEELLWN